MITTKLFNKTGVGDVKSQKEYIDETKKEMFITDDDELTVEVAEELKRKRKEDLRIATSNALAAAAANQIRLNKKDETGEFIVIKDLNDLTKSALEAPSLRAVLSNDSLILAKLADELVESVRISVAELRFLTSKELSGLEGERLQKQEELDFNDYNFYDEYFVDYEEIRKSINGGE